MRIPQLADIEQAFQVARLVADGLKTKGEIAAYFGVDDRQGNYRMEAAEILGLISRKSRKLAELTAVGHRFLGLSGPALANAKRNLIGTSEVGNAFLNAVAEAPEISIDKLTNDAVHWDWDRTLKHETLEWRVPAFVKTLQSVGLLHKSGQGLKVTDEGSLSLAHGPRNQSTLEIGQERSRIVHDVERRQSIERAAVLLVTERYLNAGCKVESREREAKGWDLDVFDPLRSDALQVEVKGTTAEQFQVELTPNEYGAMCANPSLYRVCVVTCALSEPHLQEFIFNGETGSWHDSASGSRLVIKERVGARLS